MRGYGSINWHHYSRREPLTPTLSPQARGEGEARLHPRHCEERKRRSNPFFLCVARWIASLAAPLAMTERESAAVNSAKAGFSPRDRARRSFAGATEFVSRRDAPRTNARRAQGRPGARCTRGLACTMHKANAHEHTGSAETLRPSLRNGFTAYNGLSPVTGLFCHRRSREAIASQELDASVGASGPHDFAVRIGALVSRAAASIASRLAFRDDCAYAPPVRRDGASW